MSREEVLTKLKEIIVDIISDEEVIKKINEDTRLVEDLGFDSLNMLMMAMGIEESFNVPIQEMNSDTFKSVKDVIDYIIK